MNLLQVVPSISGRHGGPARAVLELSEALAARGHRVRIFATDHGYKEREAESELPTNGTEVELFKLRWPRLYFYSPSLKQALKRSIRNFDIVHIHGLWLHPTLAASRICRAAGIPYVIRPCGMLNPRSMSHHRFRKYLYHWLIESENLNSAQAIHFTTQDEKDRSDRYGLSPRAIVIPLGLKLNDYLSLPPKGEFRKRHPHLEGKKIILYLGRINFIKGLDLLAAAFAELVRSVKGIHWVIAGPDDKGYGKKLKRWINAKRIENAVTWTGFLEGREKLTLLRDSDIFCLPSYQESFGLAALEAMAAGLPVVVSNQVSICREIESAQAGFVTPLNVLELRSGLNRLLQDQFLRDTMGRNGQKLVQEKYGWDRIAQDLTQLYERICSGALDAGTACARRRFVFNL